MWGYEINTPGKAEFQNFWSQEELDAALKLWWIKEWTDLSLEEQSQKWAKNIVQITKRAWVWSDKVAEAIVGKNTPKAIDKAIDSVLTKPWSDNKQVWNENISTVEPVSAKKEDFDIAEWEQKGIEQDKEFTIKKAEILKNIEGLEKGKVSKTELSWVIAELVEEHEYLMKQYSSYDSMDFENKELYNEGNGDFWEKTELKLESLSKQLFSLRKKSTELFPENSKLENEDKLKLRQIGSTDFLRDYTQEQRLRFITTENLSWENLNSEDITFTFSYDWVFNRELYLSTTAGQVLPKTVWSVNSNWTEYTRTALLWEFFSQDWKRLKIWEGTKLTDISYRSGEDVMKLERVPQNIEGNLLKVEAYKRWINPDLFNDIAGQAIGEISDKHNKSVIIEEFLTSFDRYRDIYWLGNQEFTNESIKSSWDQQQVISALFHSIYTKWEWSFVWDTKWISKLMNEKYSVSAEMLDDTMLWKRIVSFLERRNYASFSERKNNCGKNVWMALNAFWIPWLPDNGRHWYRWGSFLENHSMFEEKPGMNAQSAPAGSVISYNKWTGWSDARKEYGHVEIALWSWKGYYFGKLASNPGWSNKNPQQKDYRVFVPRWAESNTAKVNIPNQQTKYTWNYWGSTLTDS